MKAGSRRFVPVTVVKADDSGPLALVEFDQPSRNRIYVDRNALVDPAEVVRERARAKRAEAQVTFSPSWRMQCLGMADELDRIAETLDGAR